MRHAADLSMFIMLTNSHRASLHWNGPSVHEECCHVILSNKLSRLILQIPGFDDAAGVMAVCK